MNVFKTREKLTEAATKLQFARNRQHESDRPLRIRIKAESDLLRIGRKFASETDVTTDVFEHGPIVDITAWRKHRTKLLAQFLIIGRPVDSGNAARPASEKQTHRTSAVETVRGDTKEVDVAPIL
jgi:hypothetical protein